MQTGGETDSERRLRKRQDVVAAVKRSPDYQMWATYRSVVGEFVSDGMHTPDPADHTVSKRAWELNMKKWRRELAMHARAPASLDLPSAICDVAAARVPTRINPPVLLHPDACIPLSLARLFPRRAAVILEHFEHAHNIRRYREWTGTCGLHLTPAPPSLTPEVGQPHVAHFYPMGASPSRCVALLRAAADMWFVYEGQSRYRLDDAHARQVLRYAGGGAVLFSVTRFTQSVEALPTLDPRLDLVVGAFAPLGDT